VVDFSSRPASACGGYFCRLLCDSGILTTVYFGGFFVINQMSKNCEKGAAVGGF